MKIAIMQPYFLPYIGYFQLINAVDKFVIYDDVNYINRGWVNRNKILINNKPTFISIPLVKASQNRLINNIAINDEVSWQKKMIKSIQLTYARAPYFNERFPVIEDILSFEDKDLSRFLVNSIKATCNYLNIKTSIIESSSCYHNSNLRAESRIIDICKKEKANYYINPIGGRELYAQEVFQRNGTKLNFIQPNRMNYQQYSNSFEPWLSIIDVLMFNSRDDLTKHLDNYVLE